MNLLPNKQRTIADKIELSGISLHGGERVTLTLHPAPDNTGIVFRRVDLHPAVEIAAKAELVTETMLQTVLTQNNAKVGTVEHLLSGIAGLGIDNLYIDIDAIEVPIMDGSSSPFIYLIKKVGIKQQDALKRFIKIKKEIKVEMQDKWATLKPFDGFHLAFTIDFDHPVLQAQDQFFAFDFSCENYINTISKARTFGFVSGLETLRTMGLAKGGSLDNAIGLDDYSILNEGGLRFEGEFIKHKILDAVGDLFLLGAPILGAYEGFKSGHAVNNALCRELIKQTDAWEYVTFNNSAAAEIKWMTLLS